MPIISSEITLNNLQCDGRRVIQETHIDDLGQTYIIDYMADASTNIEAKLNIHANEISAQLAEVIG